MRGEILLASDIPQPTARVQSGKEEDAEQEEREANELADLGLLVPNLELATGCSPAHLPGSPPSPLAQSLTQRILTLLHTTRLVRLDDLRIWHHPPTTNTAEEEAEGMGGEEAPTREVVAYWTLYIDIVFISLDGNPFDAAWAAVVAALRDTLLPNAWWDGDRGMILCDDAASAARKLNLRGRPVASTFAVFEPQVTVSLGGGGDERGVGKGRKKGKRAWILADPDAFEEGLCGEMVTLVVDVVGGRTKILRIEKAGGGVVGGGEMRGLVGVAEERWREWEGVLGP